MPSDMNWSHEYTPCAAASASVALSADLVRFVTLGTVAPHTTYAFTLGMSLRMDMNFCSCFSPSHTTMDARAWFTMYAHAGAELVV